MAYSWEPPFVAITALFMAVMSGLGLYQWRKWRREQRQQRADDAAFDAMMREIRTQEHADLAARRILQLADTMPPMPALPARPTVAPAWTMDASDTSEERVYYCPLCALERMVARKRTDIDGFYPLPRGRRVLCAEHCIPWEERITGDVL